MEVCLLCMSYTLDTCNCLASKPPFLHPDPARAQPRSDFLPIRTLACQDQKGFWFDPKDHSAAFTKIWESIHQIIVLGRSYRTCYEIWKGCIQMVWNDLKRSKILVYTDWFQHKIKVCFCVTCYTRMFGAYSWFDTDLKNNFFKPCFQKMLRATWSH